MTVGVLGALVHPRLQAAEESPVSGRGEVVRFAAAGGVILVRVDEAGRIRELRSWRSRSPIDPSFDIASSRVSEGPLPPDLHWSRVGGDWLNDDRAAVALAEYPYGWPLPSMVTELVESEVKGDIIVQAFSGEAISRNAPRLASVRAWLVPPRLSGFIDGSPDSAMTRLATLPRWGYSNPQIVIPGRLVLGGFTINSLLFACFAWLFIPSVGRMRTSTRLLVRAVRGRVRARRGACRACGYALAGLARCPECGTLVK